MGDRKVATTGICEVLALNLEAVYARPHEIRADHQNLPADSGNCVLVLCWRSGALWRAPRRLNRRPGRNAGCAANQHHHGAATQQQADRTECRCCDDCAVACVFSACNPGATSFVSVDTNYDRPNRYDPVAISAHDGPVLFPPLRPPIQSS